MLNITISDGVLKKLEKKFKSFSDIELQTDVSTMDQPTSANV